jgi:tetratricopeptide (TPR) repeat protein
MGYRPRTAARDGARGAGDLAAYRRSVLPLVLIVGATMTMTTTAPPPARADDAPRADAWESMRVMARVSGTRLKIGSEVTALLNAGSVFRIDRVRGDWLWVDSGNIRGWVKKDAVVPFDRAVSFFSEVIAREPKNAYALICRGMARHARRDFEGAIADDTAVIAINPKDPWAFHNRAAAFYARNELEKALRDAEEAMRLDPDEAAHHANLGSVRFVRKEYDRAIVAYSEAIAKLKGAEASLDDSGDEGEPGQTSGRLCRVKWTTARAECWAASRAPEKALADFTVALQTDPRDFATLNSFSWLLATCSDRQFRDARRALTLAVRACELTGYRNHLCLDTLAAAYAEEGDFAAAVRWLTRALELASGDRRFTDNYAARLKLFLDRIPYHEEPEA